MMSSLGRLGDFGDRGSVGVGGSNSINMSVADSDIFGRFGIGRSNGGVCLFGISTVLQSWCAITFTKVVAF